MKKFKVWIHIEEIDEENDHYEDIGIPESAGVFETYDLAQGIAEELASNGRHAEELVEKSS